MCMSMASRMTIAVLHGGSSATLGLLDPQCDIARRALNIKVGSFTDPHGAVTRPLAKVHVVECGAVEEATVVPDGYRCLLISTRARLSNSKFMGANLYSPIS